jgi:chondroitin AC lyase
MRDGFEYYDIDPVWDFARIPGTLAVHESDEQLYKHTGWEKNALPSDHCGGAVYDGCGIIYERCEHGGVSLYVTDFAIPHGFVSLGADISCTEGVARLTVDQALFRGNAVEDGASVIHNGIRYTPLDGSTLTYECDTRRGSWRRNSFARPDTEVSMPVFDIGRECAFGSYAYMISSASMPMPGVRILRNDSDCQAIELDNGTVLAVFHKPASLSCGGRIIEGGKGVFAQFPELA